MSIENLLGSAFNDKLIGDDDENVLTGGGGADQLIGGDGNDMASYATATAGVVASLADPSANLGDALGDTYSSIENLTGSDFADTHTGDSGANVLTGGKGADVLTGGGGADTFAFDAKDGSADTIRDFEAGIDKLSFDASVFFFNGGSPTPGVGNANFITGAFGADALTGVANAGIQTFIYNTDNGHLLYDDDGSGGHAASIIAVFDDGFGHHAAITATDLVFTHLSGGVADD